MLGDASINEVTKKSRGGAIILILTEDDYGDARPHSDAKNVLS
jgi:hypothetical protein